MKIERLIETERVEDLSDFAIYGRFQLLVKYDYGNNLQKVFHQLTYTATLHLIISLLLRLSAWGRWAILCDNVWSLLRVPNLAKG